MLRLDELGRRLGGGISSLALRFVDNPEVKASRPFAAGDLRERGDDSVACEDLVHPCGPDTYYGSVTFESCDRWEQRWRVEGPRKCGDIVTTYERIL